MADIIPSTFTAQSIAHLYRWGEIEGWQLLARHFELTDDQFSFIVVFAPDDWAIALLRDQLRQILPEPGAIARVRFDPAKGPDSLAESLLEFAPNSASLRLIWIDADPAEPDAFEEHQRSWELALMKLNRYRNTLQKRFPCTVALALPGRFEQMLSGAAPDIWSIRSGVYRIEPAGTSRELIGRLPKAEWLSLDRDEGGDTGDPAETLAEAAKLRGKPGRELLLAALLQRAGNQARRQMQWDVALTALQEAYTLQANVAADPELRWEICRDLANVFDDVAQYDRAEFYLQQALQTAEQHFGPDSHKTAVSLNDMAYLFSATNRLASAEPLIRRALAIKEASFGINHPTVAISLNNLANLLSDTNRLLEAEPLMRRALAINEMSFGRNHPHVAISLNNLANLLNTTNRLLEAESLMRRALVIDESNYGSNHPNVAVCINNLAALLLASKRLYEAEPLMRRVLTIDEACFGSNHPTVARDLINLAELLKATNRLSEAEPLIRRALKVFEQIHGKIHPDIAIALNNLAQLLYAMHKFAEAEPLFRRALAIDEASFGNDHPTVASRLNNLAVILKATNRLAEAEEFMRKHLVIYFMFEQRTGHQHSHLERAIDNFTILLEQLGRNPQQIQREIANVEREARGRYSRRDKPGGS